MPRGLRRIYGGLNPATATAALAGDPVRGRVSFHHLQLL
jgi:hypothetical protein